VTVDPNDPRPTYQQVADDVRQMVAAGRYPPGTRLPSVRRLADEYGLAPQTVQNALRVLREEGLVVSQQGRAYFVRDPDRPVGGTTAGDGQLRERLELVEAGLRELQGRVAALEADRH
jgi:GntR family transcriptional regulator